VKLGGVALSDSYYPFTHMIPGFLQPRWCFKFRPGIPKNIFSLCSHKDANLLIVLVFRLPAVCVSAASNASANDWQEERIMTILQILQIFTAQWNTSYGIRSIGNKDFMPISHLHFSVYLPLAFQSLSSGTSNDIYKNPTGRFRVQSHHQQSFLSIIPR
jgi:hypothetical protein